MPEVLKPIHSACVATFFFVLLDSAHFEERGAARLVRSHAFVDVSLSFAFDVILEFLIESLVHSYPR